jgi:ribosome-binding factor A
MSHRIAQVEATLKKAISLVLQRDLADPRIEGFISITRVKISPDLRNATIYVSIMPEDKQSKNIHGLRHATGHIRSLVLKQMATRTVPRFKFVLDESLKKQAAVMEAIYRGSEKTTDEQADTPGKIEVDAADTPAGDSTEPDIQTPDPTAAEDGPK